MTDWLPLENEMLFECGKAGGEYLDSMGKSDLAALSKDEWLVFCKVSSGDCTKFGHDYDRKIEAQFEEDPFGLPPLK